MAESGSFAVRTANLLSGSQMVHVGADQDQSLAGSEGAAAQTPAASAWQSLTGHASSAGHQAATAADSLGRSLTTAAVAYNLAESANRQSFSG